YVRKTKNNYERYVPMSRGVICDLERYLYDARPILLIEGSNDTALFISERGGRISAFSMDKRLEQLKKKTVVLHHRPAGLHALRHSIATHLLQRGMEQENIALFLGHRSLDSTQVYTHIVNQSPGEG
ncbi:MAG: tyrosine-type recombinase/integrase, partial [Bacteroidetes bacterium]|nr:tyrosine-type recombinase/integrase [Bacteroidota bacterium]